MSNGDDVTSSSPSTRRRQRRPRILLGITGSVAAVKGPELALRLSSSCGGSGAADVRILLTRGGENFWFKSSEYNNAAWNQCQERINDHQNQKQRDDERKNIASADERGEADEGSIQIHDAEEEWKNWNRIGDPVLHIELRDWADLLVIAPLSAHTLAKIATGLCDDTLSCVVRAWDFGYNPIRPGKPLLLAPAMNTAMWQHPITQTQLTTIQQFWKTTTTTTTTDGGGTGGSNSSGVKIIAPQVKTLACGEIGNGAMASVDDIVRAVEEALRKIDLASS